MPAETRPCYFAAMSRPRPILLAALALATGGCTSYERLATNELGGAGFVDIELKPTGEGSFDFTGVSTDGQLCKGTIALTRGIFSMSKVENHACTPAHTCSNKTPAVCFEEGEQHDRAREYDKAGMAYAKGCDNGHAPSCTELALLQIDGKGLAKNPAKGLFTMEKGCKLGSAAACNNLGIISAHTEPPRLDLAFTSFDKACELGNNEGCQEAGFRYEEGVGVAADPVAGLARFDKACKAGLQRACGALGYYVLTGKGAPADVPRGAQLLGDACDKGSGEACKNLGLLLRDGTILPRDPKRAVSLFDKGCYLKDSAACNELALAYERGQGTAKDPQRADAHYQKGCDLGEVVACTNLAINLRDGLGVAKDRDRAAKLFDKACSGGLATACEQRKKLP